MNAQDDLSALADLCGIWREFHDLNGELKATSPETQKSLLTAVGMDVSDDNAVRNSLAMLRHEIEDRWFPDEIIVQSNVESPLEFGLGAAWQLRLDEDDEVFASGEPCDHITLPALPSGVYSLTATVSGRTEIVTVLAAPERLPSVQDLTGATRLWGMNLALYGLRSKRNAGLGDFEDLAQAAEVAGSVGAGFLGINPLHAMGHCNVEAISPYSPSHRGFLNTAYIALDRIPGLQNGLTPAAFDDVRRASTVQYGVQKVMHQKSLEELFERFNETATEAAKGAFAEFIIKGGTDLNRFARFEALSEVYGTQWQDWPTDPTTPKTERLDFHIWLQWVAETQLTQAQSRSKSAGMSLGLYLDLAIGSRRDGAESWCEQAAVARGVSIGAPPDQLSPEGQNWNLTAFAPRKLKALRYRPLRRIIAQVFRHAGIIRIDHVLGLNRSYWIPDDGSPGGYIRQPFESFLAIIKIEAERFNCAVVGEDLGLVPDGFRDIMRDNGFYGYSVLQYEKDAHGKFRDADDSSSQVLSCFATHDTPTVKGYETGRDIDWWEKLDWIDVQTAERMRHDRAAEVNTFRGESDFQTCVHSQLAHSQAALAVVQLDDILGVVETQNLPGTINQHPNWLRKYDLDLDIFDSDERLAASASLMNNADRGIANKGQSQED
ncbi:4-alpha-glucanotransferase [Rhodobacteraceae bacterium]|nr:4-alpha-glucanotransferase [Paracoccaceae bacterium]